MFLHISFIFFHIFLSFPFFLIVIFELKESNRPTGWKFVLHRMQAAFFRCILLGLLSRAKLRATQTLHVSVLSTSNTLNTRIEAGNTDPTTPLAYDLSTCLCSDPPVPGLAMLFNAFQKWEYAIPYLILRVTLRERHLIEIWLKCVSFVAIVWIILIVGKAHWNDLNHLESVSKDIPPGFSQDLFGEWSCQSANTLMGRSLELLLHHPLTFFPEKQRKDYFDGFFLCLKKHMCPSIYAI